jgi:hypothetical protein
MGMRQGKTQNMQVIKEILLKYSDDKNEFGFMLSTLMMLFQKQYLYFSPKSPKGDLLIYWYLMSPPWGDGG